MYVFVRHLAGMYNFRMDLNSDIGESFGRYRLGEDEALLELISSANIACGLHAGDPLVMDRTVRLCAGCGVAIGAHPGWPDLQGFGRREMSLLPDEVEAFIVYQVGALDAFARSAGARLVHVKPHGALYNQAARDPALAEAVARGVARVSREWVLVGLARSRLLEAGQAAGLRVAREAFADRAYEPDGSLRSRRLPGAVLGPQAAAAQAVSIARVRQVISASGQPVAVEADTICLHGDSPGSLDIARAVRQALHEAGIPIAPLS